MYIIYTYQHYITLFVLYINIPQCETYISIVYMENENIPHHYTQHVYDRTLYCTI